MSAFWLAPSQPGLVPFRAEAFQRSPGSRENQFRMSWFLPIW